MVGNIVKSGIAIYEIEKGKVCAKYDLHISNICDS